MAGSAAAHPSSSSDVFESLEFISGGECIECVAAVHEVDSHGCIHYSVPVVGRRNYYEYYRVSGATMSNGNSREQYCFDQCTPGVICSHADVYVHVRCRRSVSLADQSS